MKVYILIETALFTAQMQGDLKGFNSRNGFYVEDSISTLRKIKLISDGSPHKEYYILKWSQDKPTSVLARYRTDGNNYKINKIMTRQEFADLVEPDILIDL